MESNLAFEEYEKAATAAIASATSADELEAVRVEFLGKKHGRLKDLQKLLGTVPPEQRREVGQAFNAVKTAVEQRLASRQSDLSRPRKAVAGLDITLPGQASRLGHLHPITQTIEEFKDIMGRFGFSAVEVP